MWGTIVIVTTAMKHRLVALAVVSATAAVAATCVRDDLVRCASGIACPDGLRCVEDPQLPASTCAADDQFAACTKDDAIATTGTRCMVGDRIGTCFGGACLVEACGDAIVEGDEVCDDGNAVGSDGCSATCRSTEICGNLITDLQQGEQCDDGMLGLSGDGCSSRCRIEYLFWREVTPPREPSTRYAFGFTTSPSGHVLLFGGASGSNNPDAPLASFDQSWEWDGVTWQLLDPPTSPPSLARAAMAFDPGRRRVVLFGGLDTQGLAVDDTWEYDGVTWHRLAPANRPSRRVDAGLACSSARCVLFGGRTGSGAEFSDETWEWNGVDWTRLQIGSGTPARRSRAALVFDVLRDVFVMWGGESLVSFNDVHEMGALPNWALGPSSPPAQVSGFVTPATYIPTSNRTMIVSSSNAHLYGGGSWGSAFALPAAYNGVAWSEIRQRVIAVNSSNLTQIGSFETQWNAPLAASRPPGSVGGAAAYDARRGITVLFDRPGTWEWDGLNWRMPTATQSGVRVDNAAMVFDEACGDILLFGGYDFSAGQFRGDTWSYDGRRWTQLAITGPTARDSHVMIYDPVRKATILFGGRIAFDSAGPRNDTWQLSGPCDARAWTKLDVVGPSARYRSAFAFDRTRGVGVLFGGLVGPVPDDETWIWDGAAWAQAAVAAPPAARSDHAIAFAPRMGSVVMAGGRVDSQNRLDDLLRWTGSEWQPLSVLSPVDARGGHSLVPDRTGGLVMIGGDTATIGSVSAIVRLSFDQASHGRETCRLDVDLDGDGLVGCDDPDCRERCAPSCPLTTPFALCTGSRCGDGECQAVEDLGICPVDCGQQ